jgi:HPt (histidine-containing phosphotransfer) domain-containing protein
VKSQELTAAREEFFSEAQEMLEQMEGLLEAMRASGGQEEVVAEAVNNFFRLVHSLKGLSAMLGFSTLSFLAHELESLLSELRMGRLESSSELLSLLENCLAAFYDLLDSSISGAEHAVNVQSLVGQIEAFIATHRRLDALDPAEHLELPDAILSALTDYERSRLTQNVRQRIGIFRVRLLLDFATFDVELERLATRIKGFGEVITTLPSGAGTGEDRIGFELLVAAKLDPAEIAIQLPEVQLEVVPYRTGRRTPLRADSSPRHGGARSAPGGAKRPCLPRKDRFRPRWDRRPAPHQDPAWQVCRRAPEPIRDGQLRRRPGQERRPLGEEHPRTPGPNRGHAHGASPQPVRQALAPGAQAGPGSREGAGAVDHAAPIRSSTKWSSTR